MATLAMPGAQAAAGARRPQVLFVHQNFPAQFVHLSQALAAQGADVRALGMSTREVTGVRCYRYTVDTGFARSGLPLARDIETKLARGAACARAMLALAARGVAPDLIVVHPGWGEALFCKEVWPDARLIVYSEFFYGAEGADYGFDPEFRHDRPEDRWALQVKNLSLLQALHACDAGWAPTEWQRSRVPAAYAHKVEVVFDGIDTARIRPDPQAVLALPERGLRLGRADEVLTFVARSLEPYRGFHVFMRALPQILRARPQAQCVIVGDDGVSYGRKPAAHANWREAMLAEVGHLLPMDRVHFLGRQPYEVYLRALQVSRCHVYLTYPFVLSWSLVEAMSVGCRIVASDTTPVREALADGVHAQLVDFFDTGALAAAAVRALGEPAQGDPLGRRARQAAVERYDLHARCLPAQLAFIEAQVRAAMSARAAVRP